jgi:modulator of FtsH protease
VIDQVASQQQRVLRNTYLLLALTMIPTVIGAFIGMRTGGIIMQHPIISTLVLIGAVIGLQFAIAANRNSGLGVVLLLGMTLLGCA